MLFVEEKRKRKKFVVSGNNPPKHTWLPARQMEEPLRLAPEAYGATIGPAVRGARTTRLSAVCAALVSLLAVCCVVLLSSGGDSQRDMTMKGLPGFELSLRSAMETWLQNSEKREQEHAAAQRLAMQRLAARQAGQHVVFNKEKRGTRSKREAGVASATAEAMQALRDTHPVKSDHATKTALQFFPIPAEPEKTSPGAGVIAFHVKTISNVPDDVADVALRNHMTVEDVVAQKGGALSSTAPKKENTLPFFGTGREEPPDRADNKEMKAKMEGLASKPTKGLVNQPWNAPSSDFLAASQTQDKTTEFDVSLPSCSQFLMFFTPTGYLTCVLKISGACSQRIARRWDILGRDTRAS